MTLPNDLLIMFGQCRLNLLPTDLRAFGFAVVPFKLFLPEDFHQDLFVFVDQGYQLDSASQLVLFLPDEFLFAAGVSLFFCLGGFGLVNFSGG